MAPHAPPRSRQPPKEKEPSSSSSSSSEGEEEEKEKGSEAESSGEEEEGSSTDEEQDREKVKNDKTPIPVAKFDPKSKVQESGSDSDPDSEGSPSDFKLQPIVAKPSAASAKRGSQGSDENLSSSRASKKSRTEGGKSSSSTPGAGAGGITRLWSNEDEIAVLNGMIDFRNVKGMDPNADMGAFYDFVRGKLRVDFSRDQLRTKIVRMKKRFMNALKKGGDGLDPVFSKPHEDRAFELSKRIWGGAVGNSGGSKNAVKENAKKDVVKAEKKVGMIVKEIVKKEEDSEVGDFWSKYPFFSASFGNVARNFPSLGMPEVGTCFVKERLSLIGSVKAKELDEKWKQLRVEETELSYKMLALMQEQVKMAFNQ